MKHREENATKKVNDGSKQRPPLRTLYDAEKQEPEFQTLNEIPKTTLTQNGRRVFHIPAYMILLFSFLGVYYCLSQGVDYIPLSPITEEEVLHTAKGGDFRIFWSSGYFAAQGTPEQAFDDEKMKAMPPLVNQGVGGALTLYPPTWFIPMGVFGAYEFATAQFFYFWGSLVFFFLCIFAAFYEHWRIALPLSFGFTGLWVAFSFGQISPVIAGLYLIAFASFHRHALTAGTALALATVKPHLGFLVPLYLLLRNHLSVILWASVLSLLLVAASLYLHGTDLWLTYLQTIYRPFERLALFQTVVPTSMISMYAGLRLAGVDALVASAGHALIALVTLVGFLRILRTSCDPELPFAAMILATLVILPHAYSYDLVLLIIPILILARRAQERGWEIEDMEVTLLLYIIPIMTRDINATFHAPVLPLVLLYALRRIDYLSRHSVD